MPFIGERLEVAGCVAKADERNGQIVKEVKSGTRFYSIAGTKNCK
jgi:hypothetical protein